MTIVIFVSQKVTVVKREIRYTIEKQRKCMGNETIDLKGVFDMEDHQHQQISPINQKERLDILDILRGFAIFGILVVNIDGMAGASWLPGYVTPTQPWYDEIAKIMVDFLATGKFYVIFSFLFGLGFSIQMKRAEEKGQALRSFYPRRLIILFIMGALHSVLFFIGDILKLYAVLGLLLLAFRKRSNSTLILWAAVFLILNFIVIALVGGPLASAGDVPDEMNFAAMAQEIHLEGSFVQVIMFQAVGSIVAFFTSLLAQGGTVMALFLMGLLAGRKQIFYHMEEKRKTLKHIWVWGLVLGLSFNGGFILFAQAPWLSSFFWIIGAPILGAAYVSGLCLLRLGNTGATLLAPIANVGRMALTNYLMHSVIGAILFNGYGFGLYEQIGRAGLWGITLAIYLVQIPISTWWLSRYGFGPIEWLWRSLTYKQRQPFRLENSHQNIKQA